MTVGVSDSFAGGWRILDLSCGRIGPARHVRRSSAQHRLTHPCLRLRRVLLSPCLNLFHAGEPMGTKFRARIDRLQHEDGLSFSEVLLGAAEEALLPETLVPPGAVWNHNARCYETHADVNRPDAIAAGAEEAQRVG